MANVCKQCGAPLEAGNKFCMTCGTPSDEPTVETVYQQQPQQTGKKQKKAKVVYVDPNAPGPDSPYEPITTKGYIGISLLMMIPIIGQILMIVWALGGCRKINKKNFARAMLIMMLIGLVISFIIGAIVNFAIDKAIEESGLNEEGGIDSLYEMLGGLEGVTGGEDLSQLEDMIASMEDMSQMSQEESGS